MPGSQLMGTVEEMSTGLACEKQAWPAGHGPAQVSVVYCSCDGAPKLPALHSAHELPWSPVMLAEEPSGHENASPQEELQG